MHVCVYACKYVSGRIGVYWLKLLFLGVSVVVAAVLIVMFVLIVAVLIAVGVVSVIDWLGC